MKYHTHKRGFSFIEVLVVVAIIAILVAISVVTFKNLEQSSAHHVVTQEVFLTLTEARNSSIASDNDTVYGVHVEATSTTLFQGATYNASDPNNRQFVFLRGVYATSSLVSNGTDIVFDRLTGSPSATGTLYIVQSDRTATNTIIIHDTGLVEK